ncbi:MAG: 3-isopropylmalate dehydrogenase [Acidobacteria bacterium]|nr:MAG: 3-isopropylmalate dehydrogenase [Acidobacteriota bacterium]
MTTLRVAVIPGDGIGCEVTPAAIRVLEAAAERFRFGFEWRHFPWGSEHYFQHGLMMPPDAIDQLRPFDAIFFGAVGDPRLQDNVTLNGLLLPIRRRFDQYACVRPAVLYPGVRCPLAGKKSGEIDFVVVRENTEGEYAQIGGILYPGGPHEVAVQSAMFTRHGTERVIRFAFDLARRRNRKRLLTSVTKSNAQGFSMGFWDRVFTDVAREYPDIRTESLLVDAACMDLVRRPEDFDVIVASNLFGDILTDLSAAITGSLGLAPSANLNPGRTFPSMFEPVHGSAPDIAGRGIANPMAAVLAGAMMLDFLGESAAAQAVEKSVVQTLADRSGITPDLGGNGTTATATDRIVANVASAAP